MLPLLFRRYTPIQLILTHNITSSLGCATIFRKFTMNGEPIKSVVNILKKFACPSLAQSWDNVGLLLEPANSYDIKKILLTNDLTEDVLEEAIDLNTNLIISYHPPVFAPLKKITCETWKQRIVGQCLANGIALYSPHTSWDVVDGGLNDWLISAFDCNEVKPLIIDKNDSLPTKFILTLASKNDKVIQQILEKSSDCRVLGTETTSDNICSKFFVECSDSNLSCIIPLLSKDPDLLYYYVNPHHNVNYAISGIGRLGKLKTPITITTAVDLLKKHLNISHVQLALARRKNCSDLIKTVGVVAGSGGSLMKNVHCDLKVTGEASHHDILESIHTGSSVILTNHSNSERGFLSRFKDILANKLNNPNVEIVIAASDSDPLKVY